MLLCRCKHPLPEEQRRKIALFTNVEERAVISGVDADDIYKIPILLHEQALDDIVVDKLRLDVPPDRSRRVAPGRQRARPTPTARSTSRMVGKYVQIRDSYMSLQRGADARRHEDAARASTSTTSSPPTSSSTARTRSQGMDAILVPGGFGERGIEGKIQAVRFAREHGMPYLGICLGMQVAIIEYGAPRARARRTPTAPSSTAPRRIR